ncbi:MAG: ferrous iron transporter B, partial [Saccharofermentans sp.]|nr:ferrous iron transporter B [Saccharofermentans sp.]MCR4688499.1 ferrous iron transporter B [Saccharofermentans sp.]
TNVAKEYDQASGMAFMIFNLLCAPCFAAIGAIKREMNNAKWTWATIGWMTGWAYALALIAYQAIGLIKGTVSFGLGSVAAIIVLGLIIFGLFRKGYKIDDSSKTLTSVEAKS